MQQQASVFAPPPQWGGLDLNSSNSGCARLGSGEVPPLGVVEKEVAVLIVLVRRHRCMRLTSSNISANAPTTKTSTRPPLHLLSAVAIGPSEPGGWPLSSPILAARLR